MNELFNFFNKLFGRQNSGETARERLRLVLMSDHLSLAPETVDEMKMELIEVVSRYVEVDRENIDVHFEHQERTLAMLANIPIVSVNRDIGPRKRIEQPRLISNGSRRRRRRKKNPNAVTQAPPQISAPQASAN